MKSIACALDASVDLAFGTFPSADGIEIWARDPPEIISLPFNGQQMLLPPFRPLSCFPPKRVAVKTRNIFDCEIPRLVDLENEHLVAKVGFDIVENGLLGYLPTAEPRPVGRINRYEYSQTWVDRFVSRMLTHGHDPLQLSDKKDHDLVS